MDIGEAYLKVIIAINARNRTRRTNSVSRRSNPGLNLRRLRLNPRIALIL
jgi:hypothetical protein